MDDCIFCRIARGESPSHMIWEDENHLAFLSIYPNTEAFSVVITRQHYPSYAFGVPDEVLCGLVLASQKTALLIDRKLPGVGRTGLILEGFGVNHLHSKLFPMHGTGNMKEWRPIDSNVDKYFTEYEGYLSSHDHHRAEDHKLAKLAARIRE